MSSALRTGTQRVTTLQDTSEQSLKVKQLNQQETEQRKKKWETAIKSKNKKRKDILNSFEEKSNTKKPINEKEEKTLEQQKKHLTDSQETKSIINEIKLELNKEKTKEQTSKKTLTETKNKKEIIEEDIFEKLKEIKKTTKNKK